MDTLDENGSEFSFLDALRQLVLSLHHLSEEQFNRFMMCIRGLRRVSDAKDDLIASLQHRIHQQDAIIAELQKNHQGTLFQYISPGATTEEQWDAETRLRAVCHDQPRVIAQLIKQLQMQRIIIPALGEKQAFVNEFNNHFIVSKAYTSLTTAMDRAQVNWIKPFKMTS